MHEGMAMAAEWCLSQIVPDLKKKLLKHEGYGKDSDRMGDSIVLLPMLPALVLESLKLWDARNSIAYWVCYLAQVPAHNGRTLLRSWSVFTNGCHDFGGPRCRGRN